MRLLGGLPGRGRLRAAARAVRRHAPSLNFITIHYIYFLSTCMISSVVFWGASTPPRSISYTDSLFLTVSAMTLAGLNTVNLSTMNTFQQCILFFLIVIGSAIFVSAFVVHVRKKAFERRFENIAKRRFENRTRRWRRPSFGGFSRTFSRSTTRVDGALVTRPSTAVKESSPVESTIKDQQEQASAETHQASPEHHGHIAESSTASPVEVSNDQASAQKDQALQENQAQDESAVLDDTDDDIQPGFPASPRNHIMWDTEERPNRHVHRRFLNMQGVGARSNASIRRRPSTASALTVDFANKEEGLEPATKHLPFKSKGYVSRNSQFFSLTEEERDLLGGYEYRAIELLSWLVPAYFVLWQLLGALGIGAYVAYNKADVARMNGLNPWWVGIFNAISAFNNSGMSLLDANMVAFQTSIYMLITMGLMILAGNTCYPVFLRLIIWTMHKLLPENERSEEFHNTLEFLLEHPRRCYTNLFPAPHTYWLLFSVVCLNGFDWIMFEVLNLGNKAITSLPNGIDVLDGLFQALAVRSGGFYVVPISATRIGLQVLYVIMMYISAYPVLITIRNSNVYEERSLGIYADDPGYEVKKTESGSDALNRLFRRNGDGAFERTKRYFVHQQLRAQLAHDLWWLVLAVWLIVIIETSNFEARPTVFSVFNVLFETVSGYGCVGISVGLPDQAYSFCGAWHTLSKLILCAVMIRGRHRGLPVAIDKAVLLPGEELYLAEEDDARLRLERSLSRGRAV